MNKSKFIAIIASVIIATAIITSIASSMITASIVTNKIENDYDSSTPATNPSIENESSINTISSTNKKETSTASQYNSTDSTPTQSIERATDEDGNYYDPIYNSETDKNGNQVIPIYR